MPEVSALTSLHIGGEGIPSKDFLCLPTGGKRCQSFDCQFQVAIRPRKRRYCEKLRRRVSIVEASALRAAEMFCCCVIRVSRRTIAQDSGAGMPNLTLAGR